MWELPFACQIVLLFVFGCCMGSFLSVCAERWGQDASIIAPGSHCPHCKKKIPWHLNIPVVSWVYLRGKSACCHQPIPVRYLLAECVVGLASAGFFAYFKTLYVPYFTLFCLLWIAFFTDLDTMIIPDEVTLFGMLLGCVFCCFWPELHGVGRWTGALNGLQAACLSMGGLFLFMSFVEYFIKKEAMGLGDVKLMGCIGAFLGCQACVIILFSGAILGSLLLIGYAAWMRFVKKEEVNLRNKRIPFGPFLVISTILYLFFPKILKDIFIPEF